jgi:alkylhydroperoxidase/carboxymuconolactone decarboxylase family protein YurZ
MRIELVERDQAPPVVQRIYDAIEKRIGTVSPFFRMLGNKPERLRAVNQLYGVVWAEGALQAKLRELATCGCRSSTAAATERGPMPLRASGAD